MSDASPSDLAVSFRSIARRRREAKADAPAGSTSALETQIDAQLDLAGSAMHTGPDASVIADAIEGVPASEWDEQTLATLRTIATHVGRLLRSMTALAVED